MNAVPRDRRPKQATRWFTTRKQHLKTTAARVAMLPAQTNRNY